MTAPQTPGREQEIRARAELRQQLADALHEQGAYCGDCDFEGESKTCPECVKVRGWYVNGVLPVLDAAVAAAVRGIEAEANLTLFAETTKLRGLLTAENRRANAAIEREETAEEAAEEVRADRDAAVAAAVRRALEDFASRLTARAASMGATHFRVDQVADAARRIAAEEHGPSVASPAREQGEADRVVAYRNSERPSVLLCREHGDGWVGLTPLTAEDLPDGGICTWGRPDGPECGRDVLITPASEQGGDAR